MWIPRVLSARLPRPEVRTLVAVTGPRQAGKTSLARQRYAQLRYVSLDAAEDRETVRTTSARAWGTVMGQAVLDEAQKEPEVFEKVKLAFDQGHIAFTVLLGSAQILLLRRVSETLAGRVLIYDLWPLMLCELAAEPGAERPREPLLARILRAGAGVLQTEPRMRLSEDEAAPLDALNHLVTWGGMPSLVTLAPELRPDWLRSYGQTYLERDLSDLARLSDLQPFRTFQRLSALRTAGLLSFSELARDAKVAVGTARNYLEYLRISYQAFLLQPYHRNITSTLVKSPKLYWSDLGILRTLTGHTGPLDGSEFETVVVSETIKWLRTAGAPVRPYFYRTRSGMEVDLILEQAGQLLAIEAKNREQVDPGDARSLRQLADAAGQQWLAGLVVHRGREVRLLDAERRIWSVPLFRLLA